MMDWGELAERADDVTLADRLERHIARWALVPADHEFLHEVLTELRNLAPAMTMEEALATIVPIGIHRGLTLAELADRGGADWIDWALKEESIKANYPEFFLALRVVG